MISTKGRYAVRFMIDLAEQPEGIPVPLHDVSVRQGISKKYLEIIVKTLVAAKLVKGASGKGGGYMLLRKPSEYTVGEVLEATEETLASVACLRCDAVACPRENFCKTLPMWKKFDSMIHGYFYGITIEDLVKGDV